MCVCVCVGGGGGWWGGGVLFLKETIFRFQNRATI